MHVGSYALKASTHRIVHAKEAAQIDITRDGHRDIVKRNAKRCRVGAIGDFLTAAKRRQDEFHRVRGRIGATEAFGFIDSDTVLPDAGLRPQAFLQRRT